MPCGEVSAAHESQCMRYSTDPGVRVTYNHRGPSPTTSLPDANAQLPTLPTGNPNPTGQPLPRDPRRISAARHVLTLHLAPDISPTTPHFIPTITFQNLSITPCRKLPLSSYAYRSAYVCSNGRRRRSVWGYNLQAISPRGAWENASPMPGDTGFCRQSID